MTNLPIPSLSPRRKRKYTPLFLAVLVRILLGRDDRLRSLLSHLQTSPTLYWSWQYHRCIPREKQAEAQIWLELHIPLEEHQSIYLAAQVALRSKAPKSKHKLKQFKPTERQFKPPRWRLPKVLVEANQLIDAQKGSLQELLTELGIPSATYEQWKVGHSAIATAQRSVLKGWVKQTKSQAAMDDGICYALIDELEELRKLEQIPVATLICQLVIPAEDYALWVQRVTLVPYEVSKRIRHWIFETKKMRTRLNNDLANLPLDARIEDPPVTVVPSRHPHYTGHLGVFHSRSIPSLPPRPLWIVVHLANLEPPYRLGVYSSAKTMPSALHLARLIAAGRPFPKGTYQIGRKASPYPVQQRWEQRGRPWFRRLRPAVRWAYFYARAAAYVRQAGPEIPICRWPDRELAQWVQRQISWWPKLSEARRQLLQKMQIRKTKEELRQAFLDERQALWDQQYALAAARGFHSRGNGGQRALVLGTE